MKRTDYRKIENLFQRAIAIESPKERDRFLDQNCAEEPSLRSKLESLIDAHIKATDYLESDVFREHYHLFYSAITEAAKAKFNTEEIVKFLESTDREDALGRLGNYDVVGIIGYGATGVVLDGFDNRLNRPVAIKLLASHLALDRNSRERFLREAQIAASLNHDNIVVVHDIDSSGRLPFIVMEKIEGESLQQRIIRKRQLPIDETLKILIQITAALVYAHTRDIVHRDIKPSNILLEKEKKRAKITDFGLARALTEDASLTRTGHCAGTPEFMSPEQALGQDVSFRTDLFSLGCTIYMMCSGRSPFEGSTSFDTMRKICEESPRPLSELKPETPEWLCVIVESLLEKEPAQRMKSAERLLKILKRCRKQILQGKTPRVKRNRDRQVPAPSSSCESDVFSNASESDGEDQQKIAFDGIKKGHPNSAAVNSEYFIEDSNLTLWKVNSPEVSESDPHPSTIGSNFGSNSDPEQNPHPLTSTQDSPLPGRSDSRAGSQTANIVRGSYRSRSKKSGLHSLIMFFGVLLGGVSGICVAIVFLWSFLGLDPLGLIQSQQEVSQIPNGAQDTNGKLPEKKTNPGKLLRPRDKKPKELVSPSKQTENRQLDRESTPKSGPVESGGVPTENKVEPQKPAPATALLAPRRASAPFNAAKAKAYQQEWAKFLGVPIEFTNSIGMKFVLIPPGTFRMGSDREETDMRLAAAKQQVRPDLLPSAIDNIEASFPSHPVTITRPYYLCVHETTRENYSKVAGNANETSQRPANSNWDEAVTFCQKLSALEDRTYCLPTEAEWEFAVRAGTTGLCHFDGWDAREDFEVPLLGGSQEVIGNRSPNPWGLYDVYGNVGELCLDGFSQFTANQKTDPIGPNIDGRRVARGGGWNNNLVSIASASRSFPDRSIKSTNQGFRVLLEIPSEKLEALNKKALNVPLAAASPIPADAQIDVARQLFLEVYGERQNELQELPLKEKRVAYAKLAQEVGQLALTTSDSAEQYVLLKSAFDFAIASGDAKLTEEALVAFNTAFEIDDLSYRRDAVVDWASRLKSEFETTTLPDAQKRLLQVVLPLLERSSNEWRFEVAIELAELGVNLASGKNQVKAELRKKLKELKSKASRHAAMLDLEEAVKAQPNPDTALKLGEYYCFEAENWEKGLVYLAMASDAELKRVANLEVKGATKTEDQIAVGDAWWDLAASRKETQTLALKKRAAYWYELAFEQTSGVTQALLAKRLKSLENSPPPANAPFDQQVAQSHQKAWADYLGLPVEFTNSIGMRFVLIPPGTFIMGSGQAEINQRLIDAEKQVRRDLLPASVRNIKAAFPPHQVTITRPYYLCIHETTRENYGDVMGNDDEKSRRPTIQNWIQATGFCDTLGKREGRTYRLPTEAEWEFATRAGTTDLCHFAPIEVRREYEVGLLGGAQEVIGNRKPNPWGIYDVYGNVGEWCLDGVSEFPNGPVTDPKGPWTSDGRIIRGGGWNNELVATASAQRGFGAQDTQSTNLGFRILLEIPIKKLAGHKKHGAKLPSANSLKSDNHLPLEFKVKPARPPLPDGTVLALSFDVDSVVQDGKIIQDLSDHDNDAKNNGGVIEKGGVIGECVRLDGQAAIVSLSKQFPVERQPRTVSVWLKTEAKSDQNILGLGKTRPGKSEHRLTLNDGKVYFSEPISSPPFVADGNWHHVVGTWNGNRTPLRIYVDGQLMVTGPTLNYSTLQSDECWIGADQYGKPNFMGWMDEILVLNRGLTDEEVLQLFSSQSQNFDQK